MTTRPKTKPLPDQWVETRTKPETGPRVKPKRLTIDIDPTLHTRLKVHCASNGLQIADLMRDLIERELS